jgi:dolichyl-phosphate-mannose-protein mannosyltransferase
MNAPQQHPAIKTARPIPAGPALLVLLVAAQAVFLLGLEHPQQMFFDETHYVPAARDLITATRYGNIEHPLAAKMLIGLSMLLFGDTPWGWRVLGTLAGTATVAAIFGIAWSLFHDSRVALIAGALALLNQTLFIQARIAMLDVYMGAFLTGALWLLIDGYAREQGGRWHLAGAGALFGLAIGSKWLAIPFLGAAGLAFLLLRARSAARAKAGPRGFLFSGDMPAWRGVSTLAGAALLGAAALLVYLATFAPALFVRENALSLAELIPHQLVIYAEQTKPLAPHTYQSQWWQWPLMERPIWYLYERVDGVLRGVLLIGNPAVMWGGLVAVAACLWGAARARDPRLLLVAGLWLFSYGIWALIPKKIGFFYYYYVPGLMLPLALAAAFQHFCQGRLRWLPPPFLVLTALLFWYFHAIIAATPLAYDDAFKLWTWFESWK